MGLIWRDKSPVVSPPLAEVGENGKLLYCEWLPECDLDLYQRGAGNLRVIEVKNRISLATQRLSPPYA